MRYSSVALINPPSPWLISDTDLPPIGLLSLAASMRAHGVRATVTDLAGVADWEGVPLPAAELYGVGFTTPQYTLVRRLIEFLPKDRTVLGGAHCSALPERTLAETGVRAVFKGEADWALADYVTGRRLACIPGLVWEGGNNPLPTVDPDLLPFPAYDMVDIDRYHRADTFGYVGGSREGYLHTGRGCPYRCAFCAQDRVTGGKVRWKSVERVVAEASLLKMRYGCDQLYIEDDTFNLSKPRVLAICDALKSLHLRWHCLCRADRLDREMTEGMRRSGCRAVVFGFESGSDRMLKLMNKGTTVEDNLRAAVLCHEAGLRVRAQMIVGFPGEDEGTIAKTERFVREAAVDKWGFHAFVPLPGSDVWEHPEKYGIRIDKGTDFGEGFTTIGRPGEWAGHPEQTVRWLERLNEAAGEAAIWREMWRG